MPKRQKCFFNEHTFGLLRFLKKIKLIKIIIERIIKQLFRDRNKTEFMVFLLYLSYSINERWLLSPSAYRTMTTTMVMMTMMIIITII